MNTSAFPKKIKSSIFYLVLFGTILLVGIKLFDVMIFNDGASFAADVESAIFTEPRRVEVVEEDFWGDGELHVRVKNIDKTAAFVRLLPEFTACDRDGEVCDLIVSDDDYLSVNSDYWIRIGAYYYYKYKLDPGKYTRFFIESYRTSDAFGNSVEVNFKIEGVDCSNYNSVEDRWKIKVNSFGEVGG